MDPNHTEELGLEARTAKIPGVDIDNNKWKRICILGLGNLGTRVANLLCSLGFSLMLIDSGTVERADLGYQELYTGEWLDRRKVIAAKAKLVLLQDDYPTFSA